jgi:hypothetical protein
LFVLFFEMNRFLLIRWLSMANRSKMPIGYFACTLARWLLTMAVLSFVICTFMRSSLITDYRLQGNDQEGERSAHGKNHPFQDSPGCYGIASTS